MKIIVEPEAQSDIREHPETHQEFILNKLAELEQRPVGHENSDSIKIRNREVFKYVMKQGSKGGKDYRAVYDIIDGEIRVIAVFKRDTGYDKEKIHKRLKS